MPTLIGNTAKAAFAKDPGRQSNSYSAYPAVTMATLGANDMLPLLGEGVKHSQERLESKAFIGQAFEDNSELQNIRVGGSLRCEGYFEGALPELIFCGMGWENVNAAASGGSPANLGGGAYGHIFELDQFLGRQSYLTGEEVLANAGIYAGDHKVRSGALGLDKAVSVERIRSAMINQMTINATPESVDYDFDMVCYERQLGDPGAYGLVNWTLPTVKKRTLFTGMQIYLGTLTTGLGFNFQLLPQVSQLSIVLNNNLKRDDQTTGKGLYIEEPLRNNFGIAEVSFKLARHETKALLDRLGADNSMYMSVAFIGSQIGSSGYYYTHKYFFPYLRFQSIEDSIGGTGIIAPDYKLKAYMPISDPFTGNGSLMGIKFLKGTLLSTGPTKYSGSVMYMQLINTNSSNYLSYY